MLTVGIDAYYNSVAVLGFLGGAAPMDFAAELNSLLLAEVEPPVDVLAELTKAHLTLLEALRKTGSDVSLQVEEIYDIVKDSDENAKEVRNAAKREQQLLGSFIIVSDMLDGLLQFIQPSGAGHAATIAAKRDEALKACGLERFDGLGSFLDPRFHTVAGAEFYDAPPEHVIGVLECGYVYRGSVIRKAAVIISKGREDA